MNNLQNDIQEAIEKNLPAQVANKLQERLEELEEIESSYKDLTHDYKILEKSNIDLDDKVQELSNQLQQYKEQEKRLTFENQELKTKQQELQLRESLLELKEKHTQEKCNLVMEMYRIPFANRKFREETTTPTTVHNEVMQNAYDPASQAYRDMPLRQDHITDLTTITTKIEE